MEEINRFVMLAHEGVVKGSVLKVDTESVFARALLPAGQRV